MRTQACLLFVLSCAVATYAQDRTAPNVKEESVAVVERGPHHRVIERTLVERLPDGSTRERKSSYTELATGLHYQGGNGEWLESREEIEIFNGAAVARRGPHKVNLAANINSSGAIDLQDARGQRYRSHVLGLAYTDYASGKSVMIAEVKDSIGELTERNRVLYPDAFDGDCVADIRYTYTKAGFEQDVILRTAPPSPAEWGLAPETTRLEVFTEFIEAPPGKVTVELVRQGARHPARGSMIEPDLIDQRLDFDGMVFGPGQAFPLGDKTDSFSEDTVPTGKSMERIDGRTILIEKVDYPTVERQLGRLPKSASLNRNRKVGLLDPARAMLARSLPAQPTGEPGKWTRRLQASVESQARPGFVLDYVSYSSASLTNFCFKGDTTYFITNSAVVNLYGTTVIEGGSVIKYASTATVVLYGPLDCRTAAYRPAFFTAKDNNNVGETIIGSTGAPGNSYGGTEMLFLRDTTTTYDLHDVHFTHAYRAITVIANGKLILRDAQIGNGRYALGQNAGSVVVCRNYLFYNLSTAGTVSSGAVTNKGEHGTYHWLASLRSSTNSGLFTLTNSLIVGVTNNVVFEGDYNVQLDGASEVFQTVGAGSHYLLDDGLTRDVGTTSIDPALLAALALKTTFPPIVMGDGNLYPNSHTLYIQAQRDTDTPDLGYHYDPLDYVFSGLLLTNATITAMPGVAIGTHSFNGVGLGLLSGSAFYCEGAADNLNRFVRYNMVQEQSNTNWTAVAGNTVYGIATAWSPAPVAPVLRLRFTEFSFPASSSLSYFHIYGFGEDGGTHSIRDCQFHNGDIWSERPTLNITNSLFNRTRLYVAQSSYTMNLAIRNSTFVSSSIELYNDNTGSWTLNDNLFDATTNYVEGTIAHSYNAYTTNATRFLPTNASDVKLSITNVAYQTGWLGGFYVPTNLTSHSPIFNAGSQNATNAGLYHYTMATNQTRELSTTVDIGFHYVAVNSAGELIDTDGDGLMDIAEDPNGNGSLDGGESGIGSQDTDGDGLSDLLEVTVFGSNPQSSDSDGDLLSDYDEATVYFTSLTSNDTDSDGLSDRAEIVTYMTNPLVVDSDMDGLRDGYEVTVSFTNPLGADHDGDGLSDGIEVFQFSSNPLASDSDGDGIPDGADLSIVALDGDADSLSDAWESFFAGDLDPAADLDNDGLTNLQEYQKGTDPSNFDSDGDGASDSTDASPLVSQYGNDIVWIEDGVPLGSSTFTNGEPWRWLSAWPASVSGSSNHVSKAAHGLHSHGFTGATNTMSIAAGNLLIAYVYLYPNNLPSEIMIEWIATDNTTNRAYWGGDLISSGTRTFIGALPSSGKWTRLEVPASSIALEGKSVKGLNFCTYNGWAAWDRAAKYAPDSDSDGLPDEWERKHFAGLGQAAAADPDSDGLTNLQEFGLGTNPNLADTDGDGLTDYQETVIATNPLKADSDGNGVNDGDEDADGDLLINRCEFSLYSTDPKDAYSADPTKTYTDAFIKTASQQNVPETDVDLSLVTSPLRLRLQPTVIGRKYLFLGSTGSGGPWSHLAMVTASSTVTDYVIPLGGPSYFQAGIGEDPDLDGLPTVYEVLITKTSPDIPVTVPKAYNDALGDWNNNGIPNRQEYISTFKVALYSSVWAASESGSYGEFTVTLPNPAPSGGAVVTFVVGADPVYPATQGTDFELRDSSGNLLSTTVSVPQGQKSARITVIPLNNASFNADGYKLVKLTLNSGSPPTGYTSGDVDTMPSYVILADEDFPSTGIDQNHSIPTVTLTIKPTSGGVDFSDAREANLKAGVVKFTRSSGAGQNKPLRVQYAASGTAKSGVDYVALPGVVTIPAGSLSAEVSIVPIDDAEPEYPEFVQLNLTPSIEYSIGQDNTAYVIIDDNEAATYSVSTIKPTTTEPPSGNIGYHNPQISARVHVLRTGSIKQQSPTIGIAFSGQAQWAPGTPPPNNCVLPNYGDYVVYAGGYLFSLPSVSPSPWTPPSCGLLTAITPNVASFAFGNNVTGIVFSIHAMVDNYIEGPNNTRGFEDAILSFSGVNFSGPSTATVLIYDYASPSIEPVTPSLPRIAVRAGTAYLNEAGGKGTIVFERMLDVHPYYSKLSSYLGSATTVTFDLSGQAIPGFDYSVTSTTTGNNLTQISPTRWKVTIPQNKLNVVVTITGLAESPAQSEYVESVIATMLPGGAVIGNTESYSRSFVSQAALRIRDSSAIPSTVIPDTDNDGVDDVKEVTLTFNGAIVTKYPTNPLVYDTDGDGLPDGFDWNGLLDWDKDGITDLIEFDLRLFRTDSDGDGFSDSREVQMGSDASAATAPSSDSSGPTINLTSPTSPKVTPQ